MNRILLIHKNEILPFSVIDGPRGFLLKEIWEKQCMNSFICGIYFFLMNKYNQTEAEL